MSAPLLSPATLVFIGHPGHELRILGWIAASHPAISVLTDGSGSTGEGRLDATRATIEAAGARLQAPFGALSDATVYNALLTGCFDPLLDVADTLAAAIVEYRIERLVADAVEGYNPTHDVSQLLAHAAVGAAHRRGQRATVFEFDVVEPSAALDTRPGALLLDLDDEGLDQKLSLATAYARRAGSMLEQEVAEMIARHGREAFRRERLVPASTEPLESRFGGAAPFYEVHGDQRVREGKYACALRMREHVVPLEHVLRRWAMADA